jgi:hypothetical protein
MGKESRELHSYASFRMCVDSVQSCGAFRIGSKSPVESA